MPSFRSQLIGSWELASVTGTKPEDPSDVILLMPEDSKGLIMYTADGYMSCQQQEPGAPPYSGKRDYADGTDEELAETARRYLAYSGPYYLVEEGGQPPRLWHGMTVALIPNWIGNVQGRIVRIDEEGNDRFLILSPSSPMPIRGETRKVELRWKRLKDNSATGAPP